MYELKKMERYLRVNLLGPGPRLMKKEFTGLRLTKFEKHWFTVPAVNGWQSVRSRTKLTEVYWFNPLPTSSSLPSDIFHLLTVGFSQKRLFFLPLDICVARKIKPAAAIHIFSFSSFPLKCCMMYSSNCTCPLNVVRKKSVTSRKCVLSDVCVDSSFTVLSMFRSDQYSSIWFGPGLSNSNLRNFLNHLGT